MKKITLKWLCLIVDLIKKFRTKKSILSQTKHSFNNNVYHTFFLLVEEKLYKNIVDVFHSF